MRAERIEWRAYDNFMQRNVKKIGDERLTKVPRDLDFKPYRDEHDIDLVQRMLEHIDKKMLPAGVDRTRAQAAVQRLKEHVAHAPPPSLAAVAGKTAKRRSGQRKSPSKRSGS